MSSGRNDIRLIELKDTISQLNQTIRVQTEMIKDLRKTIEEHHASDEKKDQIISILPSQPNRSARVAQVPQIAVKEERRVLGYAGDE